MKIMTNVTGNRTDGAIVRAHIAICLSADFTILKILTFFKNEINVIKAESRRIDCQMVSSKLPGKTIHHTGVFQLLHDFIAKTGWNLRLLYNFRFGTNALVRRQKKHHSHGIAGNCFCFHGCHTFLRRLGSHPAWRFFCFFCILITLSIVTRYD